MVCQTATGMKQSCDGTWAWILIAAALTIGSTLFAGYIRGPLRHHHVSALHVHRPCDYVAEPQYFSKNKTASWEFVAWRAACQPRALVQSLASGAYLGDLNRQLLVLFIGDSCVPCKQLVCLSVARNVVRLASNLSACQSLEVL